MQVIHAVWCTPEEIRALADNRVNVSVSPYSELRIGFGFPIAAELVAAGVTVGLSVDTTTLSGNADMFAIMKAIQNIENGRARNEFALTARRVLELATIDGARSMGIDDSVGSLTPGKRADMIMVDTRAVNLARADGAGALARRGGAARQRRHGHHRRPHRQTRRAPDGPRRRRGRRRGCARVRGRAAAFRLDLAESALGCDGIQAHGLAQTGPRKIAAAPSSMGVLRRHRASRRRGGSRRDRRDRQLVR